MEVPRLGVESKQYLLAYATATATQDLRCICDLHCSSQQHQILSESRDQTPVFMDTSQVFNPLSHNWNSEVNKLLNIYIYIYTHIYISISIYTYIPYLRILTLALIQQNWKNMYKTVVLIWLKEGKLTKTTVLIMDIGWMLCWWVGDVYIGNKHLIHKTLCI